MDAATKTSTAPAVTATGETATVITQSSEKKSHLPAADVKGEKKPVRARHDDKWKIFSGTANDALAKEICDFLGLPLGQTNIAKFSDGETYVQIMENVRGADVFLVQPTCDPVNRALDAVAVPDRCPEAASARRITAVVPYFGYARQDRKDKPRVPISSKLVADLLTTAGADRALVVDLHAPQIQGFFNIPVDHLFASPVLVDHFRELQLPDLTVVSPDAGGVERARFFAKKMDAALAIVDKRRTDMDVTEVMHVIGDVKGRTCLILDDIIDTAGTLVKTAEALLDAGAAGVMPAPRIRALGPAIERISNSRIDKVSRDEHDPADGRRIARTQDQSLSIAGLIGRAIQSIHEETSVELFL